MCNRTISPGALPTQPYWELEPNPGPASLYEQFAQMAVEQYLLAGRSLDDETFALVVDAVHMAAGVVCRAAAIETSWTPLYERITEPLAKADGGAA